MCWSPDENTRSEYDVVADMQRLDSGDYAEGIELVNELLELATTAELEYDTVDMAKDAIGRIFTARAKLVAVAA